MNRKTATILILIALLGLIVVQLRLLVIGVKLEKQRFDQRVQIALEETKLQLEKDTDLADSLAFLLLPGNHLEQNTAFLKDSDIDEKLDSLLQKFLDKKGIKAQYAFALTNNYGAEKFFLSKGFEEKSYQFDYYTIQLGDRITGVAHGQRMLHLDITNLFNYLLGELDYLILPSLLFLTILLICLWFLVQLLRKEEQLNEVKNDFINNLTHELKTPVFSISLAEKLLEEALEKADLAKSKTLLKMIGNENVRLKTHIEKVLELASLESPNYQLKLEKVDLQELIQAVVTDFKFKLEEQNGSLQTNFLLTNSVFDLDKTHFKNVLQNLLENALKYSREQPEIYVETRSENGKNYLLIKDNGVGIPEEYQAKIFDKFFRVPTENLHQVKGFGLGLHYVKKIVEAHNGTIEVKSSRKAGTQFTLKFPQ